MSHQIAIRCFVILLMTAGLSAQEPIRQPAVNTPTPRVIVIETTPDTERSEVLRKVIEALEKDGAAKRVTDNRIGKPVGYMAQISAGPEMSSETIQQFIKALRDVGIEQFSLGVSNDSKNTATITAPADASWRQARQIEAVLGKHPLFASRMLVAENNDPVTPTYPPLPVLTGDAGAGHTPSPPEGASTRGAVLPNGFRQIPDANAATSAVRIFRLKNVRVAPVARIIEQLYGREISAAADELTNSLILRGHGGRIQEIEVLVEQLDAGPQPNSGSSGLPVMPTPGRKSQTQPPQGGPTPPAVDLYGGGSQLRGFSFNVATPQESAIELCKRCQEFDGHVQLLAEQAKGPFRDPIDGERRKQSLRGAVQQAFAARQALLRAENSELAKRLHALQQSVEMRDRVSQQIIDRRVEDLLNPDKQWNPTVPAATAPTANAASSEVTAAEPSPSGDENKLLIRRSETSVKVEGRFDGNEEIVLMIGDPRFTVIANTAQELKDAKESKWTTPVNKAGEYVIEVRQDAVKLDGGAMAPGLVFEVHNVPNTVQGTSYISFTDKDPLPNGKVVMASPKTKLLLKRKTDQVIVTVGHLEMPDALNVVPINIVIRRRAGTGSEVKTSQNAFPAETRVPSQAEKDKNSQPILPVGTAKVPAALSDSPEGSKTRPQPTDRERDKDAQIDLSFNNPGTLTKTLPHESPIPVRAKLLVIKRDWSNANELKPQDGIRKSLSELPDTPVSRAARAQLAKAGSLGPDDLVSNLGLPSVFGAEDFASLQSWLRDQGLLLGELPVEQKAERRAEERWTSWIDLSAAHVEGVIGKWWFTVDMRPASARPDEQGIFRVVDHPYYLALINTSRTQQVMERQPGGPHLRGAALSKKPKFSFYLPKKRVVAIDWDAPFTGKEAQLNEPIGSKVILVFEDAEVPEPRSTVAGFRLPERIGSLGLDDEGRWLSPPDKLGANDRAAATARPEPVTDAASQPAGRNTPEDAATQPLKELRWTAAVGRQALLASERDKHTHPPIEFRIAVSKTDREADEVAWFPIIEPRTPAPAGKSGANLPIEEKLKEKWHGLLSNKVEHTLIADGSWRVVKCDVAQSAQSTDLVPSFEIRITLDAAGGALLRRLVSTHLNQSLAIVVDGTIVAAPVLRSEFGLDFVISGNFSKETAEKLAAAIRKPDRRKTVSYLLRFTDITSAVADMKAEAAGRKIRGFDATIDPRLNAVAITADPDTLEALREILARLDSADEALVFRAEIPSKNPTSAVIELADLGLQHDGKEVTMIFKITDTQLIGGEREGAFPHVLLHYDGMKKPPHLGVYVKGELADVLHRSACVAPDDKLVGRSIKATGTIKIHTDFPKGEDQTPIYQLELRDWKKFQILPEAKTKSKLEGVWIAEKVTTAGEVVPKEKFPFELHFEKEQLIFRFVAPSLGKDRVHEIVVDETKTPATIDITREVKGQKETVYGIYKFEDDRLWICSLRDSNRQPSKERPTTFDSSNEVRSDLLVLTRKPVPTK